jgi:hypothetical protein
MSRRDTPLTQRIHNRKSLSLLRHKTKENQDAVKDLILREKSREGELPSEHTEAGRRQSPSVMERCQSTSNDQRRIGVLH